MPSSTSSSDPPSSGPSSGLGPTTEHWSTGSPTTESPSRSDAPPLIDTCGQPPSGPWLRTWCLAVALAALALFALECHWRSLGHRPSTVDDQDRWALERSRVYGPPGRTLVLVGQSRFQLGIATDVIRARFPELRVVNLAVEGAPPLATLRDLAQDPAFCGIVLCDAVEHGFERCEREKQMPWVRHYHDAFNANGLLDRWLASLVQDRLVVRHPQVRLSSVALAWIEGERPPAPLYLVTHADRSKSADYTLLHLPSHRAQRVAKRAQAYRERAIPSPTEWAAQAADVVPWLRQLEARGGRAAFVRMPTSGEHWQLDERYYPRARYWDQLAAITGAVTVHFRDDPRTARFECPDTSHLDQRDAPAFTAGLLEVLVERGVLPGAAAAAAAPSK